jgi:hypothetical protein
MLSSSLSGLFDSRETNLSPIYGGEILNESPRNVETRAAGGAGRIAEAAGVGRGEEGKRSDQRLIKACLRKEKGWERADPAWRSGDEGPGPCADSDR